MFPGSIVRASLGAMSTAREVDIFVEFLYDTFAKPDCGAERTSDDSGKAFVETAGEDGEGREKSMSGAV